MADVVVRLDRGKLERFLEHALESADKFRLPAPVEPVVEELRAALDSPPVEERVEYRVAYDVRAYSQEIGTYEIPLADPSSLEEAELRAEKAHLSKLNVRVQRRTLLTSPWTDLPSEEEER